MRVCVCVCVCACVCVRVRVFVTAQQGTSRGVGLGSSEGIPCVGGRGGRGRHPEQLTLQRRTPPWPERRSSKEEERRGRYRVHQWGSPGGKVVDFDSFILSPLLSPSSRCPHLITPSPPPRAQHVPLRHLPHTLASPSLASSRPWSAA